VQRLAARDAATEGRSEPLRVLAEVLGDECAELQGTEPLSVRGCEEPNSRHDLGDQLVRMRERLRTAQAELVLARKLQPRAEALPTERGS